MSKPKHSRNPKSAEPAAPGIPLRAGAGIAAVVLLYLTGALNAYQEFSALAGRPDSSQIAVIEERLRGVAAVVPPLAQLAYLSDVPFAQGGYALHAAAQYVIAPRLLDPSPDARREWVLGDFYQPYDAQRIAREHDLNLVRDFGNGVVVFRRGGR